MEFLKALKNQTKDEGRFALGIVQKLAEAKNQEYYERAMRLNTDPWGPVKFKGHPYHFRMRQFAQVEERPNDKIKEALDELLEGTDANFKKIVGNSLEVALDTLLGNYSAGTYQESATALTVAYEEIIRVDTFQWRYNFEYKGLTTGVENAICHCTVMSIVYPQEVPIQLLRLMINKMVDRMKFKNDDEKEAKRKELIQKMEEAHKKPKDLGALISVDDVNQKLTRPTALALSPHNVLYVLDSGSKTVWKKTADGTLTEAVGKNAALVEPADIAVDGLGNVFIADKSLCKVVKVTPGGAVTTVADGSTLDKSSPSRPVRLGLDNAENLYVTAIRTGSKGGHEIWHVRPGHAEAHKPSQVKDQWVPGATGDHSGHVLLASPDDSCVWQMTPQGRNAVVVAGGGTSTDDNGLAVEAKLGMPHDVDTDRFGNIYFTDPYQNDGRIRKVTRSGIISTVVKAQDGVKPTGLAANDEGTALYFVNEHQADKPSIVAAKI